MFLLTAFLGFAGLVALVAYKQGMFESHTEIHFHAPDATGINKGMAVRLHGVLVGTVNDVQLVERVGCDADGREEPEQRRDQMGDVDAGRQARADHDVREVPGGVGRM